MTEPLDLELIRAHSRPGNFSYLQRADDVDVLLAEVERLRGEVARQAEQITAVRAVVAESRRIARSRRIALSLSSNADILRALDGTS